MNRFLWAFPVWFHEIIQHVIGLRLVETSNGDVSYAWVNDATWAERINQ